MVFIASGIRKAEMAHRNWESQPVNVDRLFDLTRRTPGSTRSRLPSEALGKELAM